MNEIEEIEELLELANIKIKKVGEGIKKAGAPKLGKKYEFVGMYLDLILHYMKGCKS